MNPNNLCWLAGFLEGEGSFMALVKRGQRQHFVIEVSSSDIDVLHKACWIFGRHNLNEQKQKFRDGYTRRRHYRVTISGSLAIQWMMTLYSLMGKRRKSQIREVILAWRAWHGITKAETEADGTLRRV